MAKTVAQSGKFSGGSNKTGQSVSIPQGTAVNNGGASTVSNACPGNWSGFGSWKKSITTPGGPALKDRK